MDTAVALDRALCGSTAWQREEWRREGVLERGEYGGDARVRRCEELGAGYCGYGG